MTAVHADAIARTITIRIRADDVLTHVGLVNCLRDSTQFTVLDCNTEAQPDVYLVAVENADLSALELLKSLSPAHTGRFVLVVDRKWHADVHAAVEAGVRAVLWRSKFSIATATRMIKAVAEGEGFLPPSLQGTLMHQVQQVQREVLAPRGLTSSAFSHREIEVLRLLSEGLDLEQVSQEMRYSERTVKNILYNAMKRHQFRNRTHAVSHAIRSGLI
ncbi:LuxR C-terminal-related transcriptional regulator [Streptomyces sp. NBC_01092]|uniref:helix-turn-helix transcriptional regulator n=1 Tax=Streptomyces sp. NBC_01092 TaxID=2903748 RepID=UPI00386CFC71|nr:response regulator transcription factor [Streptomyces sp. NBC_01092]